MADPGLQSFQSGSEILAGAPIPFRFEVTWSSLTRSANPAQADLVNAPRTVTPTRVRPVRDAEAREWEMVLPKMRRPAVVAAAAPRQLPPVVAPPQFTMASEPVISGRWLGAAAAVIVLAGAAYQWPGQRHSAAKDSRAVSSVSMGGAGWITEWATGSARGRQLSLYRPSIAASDYRLDFLGRIERKSLGWVFRAADSSNYYAAKLEASGGQTLTITRFAVIHGFEGIHIQRTLRLPAGAGDMLKVGLEARGPRFTISVQNQLVEDWEDDRLKSGGVGFLNEREESGQVASIQIAFPKGGTRR
jgi:hypothetical protein